ncbi:MAG: hypothetical protein V3V67_19040 [Myxococcota bacterium]
MSAEEASFEAVWSSIRENAGEFFKTSEGLWFTYRLEADELVPSHSELRIPRSDFELAFPLLPVPPAKLNKFVKGPKYVWAILHDPRVAAGRW